jgi:hypothetical protein
MKFVIGDTDLSEALWRPAQVNRDWAVVLDGVASAIREIEPAVRLEHHGPGQISGCTWDFHVNAEGKGPGRGTTPWPSSAVNRWRVALSYRGPFLTALSWSDPALPADQVTDPNLDAHELRALEIPWEELRGDAEMRLDWSDVPTGFNLLFYEY